jgi:hypothetical protein
MKLQQGWSIAELYVSGDNVIIVPCGLTEAGVPCLSQPVIRSSLNEPGLKAQLVEALEAFTVGLPQPERLDLKAWRALAAPLYRVAKVRGDAELAQKYKNISVTARVDLMTFRALSAQGDRRAVSLHVPFPLAEIVSAVTTLAGEWP